MKAVVEPWTSLTGKSTIPAGTIYITLAGELSGYDGRLLVNCELAQLIRERFVVPSQIHLVERDKAVWRRNLTAVEQAFAGHNKPHVHDPEDVLVVLARLLAAKKRVAVLNIDLQVGPKKGIWFLTRALSMLNTTPGHPALVVWNVILKNPYGGQDMTADLETVLREHPRFERARTDGGWESPRQVRYSRAYTTMHSLVLCRSGSAT